MTARGRTILTRPRCDLAAAITLVATAVEKAITTARGEHGTLALELVDLSKSLIGFRTEIPPGNEEGCAPGSSTTTSLICISRGRSSSSTSSSPGAQTWWRGSARASPASSSAATWTSSPQETSLRGLPRPSKATVRGGRLYGRGAADMKTGVAAILKAIEAKARAGKLRRGLTFVATAGEEVGFEGLKALFARKLIPEGAAKFGVMGEPTSLRPIRAHKGLADFRITVKGRSGHASRPRPGSERDREVRDIVQAISAWERTLTKAPDADLGPTIATPTVVQRRHEEQRDTGLLRAHRGLAVDTEARDGFRGEGPELCDSLAQEEGPDPRGEGRADV